MTASAIIPVILSGGAGVRLWPLSRAAKPKQFLRFGSQHSLIQDTLLRCSGPGFDQTPIIVSGENQRFLVAEDVQAIGVKAQIVLEPMRRDSCAAIAAGCLVALQRSADAVVLILAADHSIAEPEKFVAAVMAARADANAGYLTTFGIRPTNPATGFGYIKRGADLRQGLSSKIEKFVEKPELAAAVEYVRDGYLWNSGNFLFKAANFIHELEIHAPAVLSAVRGSVEKAALDADFIRLEAGAFAQSPQISFDYAVMEKTDKAAVFAVDYQWSDIGSWDAVYELLAKDPSNNAIAGRGVIVDGQNNLIHAPERLVAMVGVHDLIVVATPDAVLVAKRGQAEKIKTLVANLKSLDISEAE